MRKLKLYYYANDSLSFREVRWGKSRYTILGLLVGVALFWTVLEINQHYGDAMGLGFIESDVLVNENRLLKEQLRFVSRRIEGLEQRLADLNDQGNQLRLLVDLPKIDEDIRKAGTGGSEERLDFTSSPDVNDLLNRLRSSVSKAEKELRLQYTSYDEVSKNYEKNKLRFAHLPAIKPMDGYYSKKGIGIRLHPVLNIYRQHEGLDIANDVGTPVYAAADGSVQYSGRDGGYGLMVEVNHGFSFKTLYAHLSKILVREGQQVRRGDLIGRSGNTGLSSGPHLHYEVRLNGVAQNPVDYFFDDINYQEYKNQLSAK
ncbi:MAG: M23 family metallopeptidase [Bacteroidota bacterium]